MCAKSKKRLDVRVLLSLMIVFIGLTASTATAFARPKAKERVVFRITGYVSDDPFSLGLQDEPFTALVMFSPDDLNAEGNKIFPVKWVYRVGSYRVGTKFGAINLDNDIPCDDPDNPDCIFDGWQVVDEANPVHGQIAGHRVTYMALNFQDHDGIALDDYLITEPLDLTQWEVHSGTINLEGLSGDIFVEVVSFTGLDGR